MNKYVLKQSMNKDTCEQIIKMLSIAIKEQQYLLDCCYELLFIDKCIIKRHIKSLEKQRNFYIDLLRGLTW